MDNVELRTGLSAGLFEEVDATANADLLSFIRAEASGGSHAPSHGTCNSTLALGTDRRDSGMRERNAHGLRRVGDAGRGTDDAVLSLRSGADVLQLAVRVAPTLNDGCGVVHCDADNLGCALSRRAHRMLCLLQGHIHLCDLRGGNANRECGRRGGMMIVRYKTGVLGRGVREVKLGRRVSASSLFACRFRQSDLRRDF